MESDYSILGYLFAFLAYIWFFALLVGIFMIICKWKIYKKAGRGGWEAIIPIYNSWVFLEIVGLKGWYILLNLIPVIGNIIFFVITIIASVRLARCFGKPDVFSLGIILLPIVFYAILAFDKSVYTKPSEYNPSISINL